MNEKSVTQKLGFDNWIALKYSVFLFLLSTSEDFIHLLQLWSYNTEISDYSDQHVTLIFLSLSVIPVNIIFEGSAVFDAPCKPATGLICGSHYCKYVQEGDQLLALSELEGIKKEVG